MSTARVIIIAGPSRSTVPAEASLYDKQVFIIVIYPWPPTRFAIVVRSTVSLINIFFVAVYQLITIRIDPFGVRNIITTPRCFVACIASWLTAFTAVNLFDGGFYNRDAQNLAPPFRKWYCVALLVQVFA